MCCTRSAPYEYLIAKGRGSLASDEDANVTRTTVRVSGCRQPAAGITSWRSVVVVPGTAGRDWGTAEARGKASASCSSACDDR